MTLKTALKLTLFILGTCSKHCVFSRIGHSKGHSPISTRKGHCQGHDAILSGFLKLLFLFEKAAMGCRHDQFKSYIINIEPYIMEPEAFPMIQVSCLLT